jgi:DNA-binding NarL/FixJ family response regulator
MAKKLTTQEIKVLFLIAEGFTNEEIADKLSISDKTVKTHR